MTCSEIVKDVLQVLNLNKIPYRLVGSLANNQYSIARSTKGAGIVVQVSLSASETAIASKLPYLKATLSSASKALPQRRSCC